MLSPLKFIVEELVITGPLLALLWITGLVGLLRRAEMRWLGYAYLALIAMMIALHAKHYYPAAVYSILFAAGAVAVEAWTQRVRALRPIIATLALVVERCSCRSWNRSSPSARTSATCTRCTLPPVEAESARQGVLTQDFSDMHGWPELTAAVVRVYDSVPPGQRGKPTIVASNYGEAAAIDVFGRPHGLPPVISGHNQYFLWGPGDGDGKFIIDVNGDVKVDRKLCAQAWVAATVSAPYAMPFEQGMPIVVCRGLRMPLAQIWPRQKVYI